MQTTTSSRQIYDQNFYADQQDGSYLSAKEILPLVQEAIVPRTIVDAGCGVGTWLRAWKEAGAASILGIDGEYALTAGLQIPAEHFTAMDLTCPRSIGRSFDLAQSLEVAEHLPAQAARPFIDFLCSLAPVVLFGAAIPFQGGTAHINERWPEYWAKMFLANGYATFDPIRPKIWKNPHVQFWYAQNTFLFVKCDRISSYPNLTNKRDRLQSLARIHPGHKGLQSKVAYAWHKALAWPLTTAVRAVTGD